MELEPPDDEEETEEQRRPPLAVAQVAPMLAEGPLAGLRLAILHGRLHADDKEAVMRAFSAGDLDVLVSTTVIEVGVDVPNATTMVIMDVDRFGLSQLHQLRGRVGRGSAPGICLLITDSPPETTARARLDAWRPRPTGSNWLATTWSCGGRETCSAPANPAVGPACGCCHSCGTRSSSPRPGTTPSRSVADDPELARHPGLASMVSEIIDEDGAEYLEKA